jgi:hypothetical protein
LRGAYAAFEESLVRGASPVVSPAGAQRQVKAEGPVAWSLARNDSDRLLLFPSDQSPQAWWSVEPSSGAVIGRGDGGEGQAAMEYLNITKRNLENLKCFLAMSDQVLGGNPPRATAQAWLMCMTGTDNPGNGNGVPGAVEGVLDHEEKVLKIGLGPIADALGGAKDLYDLMNRDQPILYTGR